MSFTSKAVNSHFLLELSLHAHKISFSLIKTLVYFSMLLCLPFLSADTALGRVGDSLLPDALLLELMLDACDAKTKQCFQNENEEYLDLDDWYGLTLDADHHVIRIKWVFRYFKGTLALDYMPSSLIDFDITYSVFAGTVTTSKLPEKLNTFLIANNEFYGSIDFCSFPDTLTTIKINNNDFRGGADLTRLPPGLQELRISNNAFTGGLNLSALPESLVILSVMNNNFSGFLDISKLPANLKDLYAHSNNFTYR